MTDNSAPRLIEANGTMTRMFNNSVRWLTRHGISIWGEPGAGGPGPQQRRVADHPGEPAEL